MNANQDLTLSLIVTSYTIERLNDIYELLESIKNQTLRNMETIFIVESSPELKDGINDFILKNSISNINVLYCNEQLGLCAARNLGVRNARGSIISFTDDDAVLPPEWAREVLKTFEDERIVGATGPVRPLWENEPVLWFPKEFYWMLGCTDWIENDSTHQVRGAFGVNMSFRKEIFETCCFSENLGISAGANTSGKVGLLVDDLDFSLQVGRSSKKTIIYNPNLIVQHKVYKYRLARQFIRTQAYWQGYSKAILRKIYGSQKERVMGTEYRMLKHIFLELIPGTSAALLNQPKSAAKTLIVVLFVLYHIAVGFVSGSLSKIGVMTMESHGIHK